MVVLAHLILFFFPYLYTGVSAGPDHDIQQFIRHSPFTFFYSGLSAVYIFFVLSGYILTAVALNSDNPLNRIFSMSLKRYPRLMIPALFSCVLAFILLSFIETSHPLLFGPFSELDSVDYTFGGALYSGAIDVFFLSGHSVYNPVLWTMKIELIGSFIVYLLCINSAILRTRVLPLLIVLIIAALVATNTIEHRLGLGLMCFIGGYFFKIYGAYVSSTKSIILLLIGLYLAGAHNDSLSYGFIENFLGKYTYALCNFLSGFIIVYAVIFGIKINKIFSLPLPVFMGKVSFSVYLIHFPIISTRGVYLFGVLYESFSSYVMSAFLTSFITIILTYGCSVIFYKYVDLKGMAMSNAISKVIVSAIAPMNKRPQDLT
jgi:peptidoglycan/LPS O-acetylase OafA/YrhL